MQSLTCLQQQKGDMQLQALQSSRRLSPPTELWPKAHIPIRYSLWYTWYLYGGNYKGDKDGTILNADTNVHKPYNVCLCRAFQEWIARTAKNGLFK